MMLRVQHLLAITLLASIAAGQSFDVASVKLNKSGDPGNSNFPLGPGDAYVPNGGRFTATGFPLITYIFFAYKLIGNQGQYLVPQLPGWATTEHFDIQARVGGNPTKDQMRLMMRALLADRFKLVLHTETREVPVFAFVLAKPGKIGPNIQPHPSDADCPLTPSASPTQTIAGGFPLLCNGVSGLRPSERGRTRLGGRNVTIGFIADSLSQGSGLGRPMIDQTGLTGAFDFTIEFALENRGAVPPNPDSQLDSSGPSLEEALREQLGIKLQAQKGSISVLVLDHVEHPSEN
jgi:uncharacterized protein (TIGR03435 family)